MSETPRIGAIGWCDLTVPDAETLKDFYASVAGWKPEALDMGGYNDFVMNGADGTPVAGVCHARGVNSTLPPYWIVYIAVTDLDARMATIRAQGGAVIDGPRSCGPGVRVCIFRDPAGAVAGLCETVTP